MSDAMVVHDRAALVAAHREAAFWADGGYSADSRAYWSGMRDTLAVVLGMTTKPPRTTGPGSDAAATTMLPACAPLATGGADARPVDPPDCGCTECITGQYRTALDWDDYYAAHPSERPVLT